MIMNKLIKRTLLTQPVQQPQKKSSTITSGLVGFLAGASSVAALSYNHFIQEYQNANLLVVKNVQQLALNSEKMLSDERKLSELESKVDILQRESCTKDEVLLSRNSLLAAIDEISIDILKLKTRTQKEGNE